MYLPAAGGERDKLPGNERAALHNAVRKLEEIGPDLPYPHSSDARGAAGLRELRPRRGSSPWRAIYRRVGGHFVIAVGPDGGKDPRGFRHASERSGGSRSWKRNDHNGEAVRAAD